MKKLLVITLVLVLPLEFIACSCHKNKGPKIVDRARQFNNSAVRALDEKHPEAALSLIDEAVALDPQFFQAYANKAAILAALKREDEAIKTLGALLAKKPDYAQAYIPLGLLLERAGKPNEAAPHFRKALELYQQRPNDPDAAVQRAIALFLLDDRAGADAAVKDILANDPHNSKAAAVKFKMEKGDRNAFIGIQMEQGKSDAAAQPKP